MWPDVAVVARCGKVRQDRDRLGVADMERQGQVCSGTIWSDLADMERYAGQRPDGARQPWLGKEGGE